MKKIVTLLFFIAALMSARAQYGLQIDTNADIVRGTNFFQANSNLNWIAISPFVAGYVAAQGFAQKNGTNFVTVQLFTNSVLSSQQIQTYTTNNAFFGLSNFLARVPGLYSWTFNAGNDAGNPPQNIIGGLIGSYTGTNAWFALTNGFWTTNDISIAQTNTGLSLAGLSRINPGYARLYSVDHLELIGRPNYFFAQHIHFDEPQNGSDAATKNYVDDAIANMLSPFLLTVDTNGVTHAAYTHNLETIFDITSEGGWIHIDGFAPDATGTNGLLTIAQTNLIAGWQVQSTTNIAFLNSWTEFTNWTAIITNAGEVTFTIPLLLPQQLFRGIVPATNNVALSHTTFSMTGVPAEGGGFFKIVISTNTPPIAAFGGRKGIIEMVSNGVFYIIGTTNASTLYTRQIAP